MEQKPELDDFPARNLDDYKRIWQQHVKTETAEPIDDETFDSGSYSPTLRDQPYSPSSRDQPYSPHRDQLYYDCYYGESDSSYREVSESQLNRVIPDDQPPVGKKRRGRPYCEASVKITCLRPGENSLTPHINNLVQMQEEGLGIPKSEMVHGLRTPSKLPLAWSSEDLKNYIRELFPRVQTFHYMKCNKSKGLLPLPDNISPLDIRDLLGRSGLYIIPEVPLLPKNEPCEYKVPKPSTATPNPSSQYCTKVRVPGEMVSDSPKEFRVTLDITNYSPKEVTVKTKGSRIVVHAQHAEKKDEYGLIERQFIRQYFLPKNVDPNEVTSSLSSNGILTLKAPKQDTDTPVERIVPIFHESDDNM